MSLTKPKTLCDIVIVRLGGEIGIKGAWTRRTYQRRLTENIRATLKHYNIPFEAVVRHQGRIYVKTSQALKAARKLTRVFGISSLSPASQTTSKLEDITATTLLLAQQKLKERDNFAVKCRRVGMHPYTSRDVCEHVGQHILEAFPKLQLKVDLTDPDSVIGIEIRENKAFIFTYTNPGPDGLPVGTQPKTITLIKPDINSAVAAWLTMKRGCPSVPVYFSQNETSTKQVKNICKALFEWSIGHSTKLYITPHAQNLATLAQKCPSHLLDSINKRLIYRIAAQTAKKEKAEAIVTGETLAQQPYQTLRQFKLQDQAIRDYPIHRPLIGLTDAEIKELMQMIGIKEGSVTKTKKRKVTRAGEAVLPTLKDVEAMENKLNIQEMIDKAVRQFELITI